VHILIYINFDSSILDLTLFTYLRKNISPYCPHHGLEFLQITLCLVISLIVFDLRLMNQIKYVHHVHQCAICTKYVPFSLLYLGYFPLFFCSTLIFPSRKMLHLSSFAEKTSYDKVHLGPLQKIRIHDKVHEHRCKHIYFSFGSCQQIGLPS
jgi:hypothetical protein